jgi:hypothetical protein
MRILHGLLWVVHIKLAKVVKRYQFRSCIRSGDEGE